MLSSAFAAAASLRSTHGKYVPHQRFNVDQVPLPFINGMDDTYEETPRSTIWRSMPMVRTMAGYSWIELLEPQ